MHCVVDSESLLMTCENDDQMLSVVDTATTPQPSERAGIGLQQILVAGSESLLMTCENDDQMLSVADTATTPQPSEAAET